MSVDWSNIYYDKLKGEKHLVIIPNSEHSFSTGIVETLSAAGNFIRSLITGIKERPTFSHKYDPETGGLSITIPKNQVQPNKVTLRYAQTLSTTRRDFRWVVATNDFS
jgi:PhoPQ-activated pathogenicity-related protein